MMAIKFIILTKIKKKCGEKFWEKNYISKLWELRKSSAWYEYYHATPLTHWFHSIFIFISCLHFTEEFAQWKRSLHSLAFKDKSRLSCESSVGPAVFESGKFERSMVAIFESVWKNVNPPRNGQVCVCVYKPSADLKIVLLLKTFPRLLLSFYFALVGLMPFCFPCFLSTYGNRVLKHCFVILPFGERCPYLKDFPWYFRDLCLKSSTMNSSKVKKFWQSTYF